MKKTLVFLSAMLVAGSIAAPLASSAARYTSSRIPGVNTSTRRQALSFIAPANGAVATRGGAMTISWNSTEVQKVTINLRRNGVHFRTLAMIPNQGQFTWIVPTDLIPGSEYSIRILAGDELVSDVRNIVIR